MDFMQGLEIAKLAIDGTSMIANPIIQAVTNQKNREFYSRQNEITRTREDTAHQREVADLQAAGLSPLANLKGSAASTPIASEMEAPTVDPTAVNDAINTYTANRLAEKTLEFEKQKHQDEMTEKNNDRNTNIMIAREQLTASKEIADKNNETIQSVNDRKLKQELQIYNAEAERHLDEIKLAVDKETNATKNEVAKSSENIYISTCKMLETRIPSEEIDDINVYIDKYNDFQTNLTGFYAWLASEKGKEYYTPQLTSEQSGETMNAGGNVKVGPLGLGANASDSVQGSWSQDPTIKENINLSHAYEIYTKRYPETRDKLKCPIFVNKGLDKKNYEKDYTIKTKH